MLTGSDFATLFVPGFAGRRNPRMGPHCPETCRAHEAEAQVVVAVRRRVPVAIRCTAVTAVGVPATAPVNAVLARLGTRLNSVVHLIFISTVDCSGVP
jgi:hypothetical protein